ncbi:RCC1 domain-containing protein [Spongisporangium articulatum]|uniref:RCC1 domain-containing protein n=1 Tax=Spongisporangium articulatum TaxID=3362603 RepID=A0ABW8AM86_9ACTN
MRRVLTAALSLLTLVAVAAGVRFTAAGWSAADANPGNTFTTGTWTSPLNVWGWGANGRTSVLMPAASTGTAGAARMPGPETWSSVSGGYTSTCGLTTAGALYCWGDNAYGQLGDGTTTDRWEPVAVAAGTQWSSVSKGYVNTCAIRASDSTAWCWGYNPDGEVGDGTTASPVTTPVQVSTTGVSSWSMLAVGQYFTCGIKTDGTLWCWGYNASGRLGDGTTTSRSVPTQVGSGTWLTVDADYHSACAVKASDQSLWCWGYGGIGQLGNNSTADQSSPVTVSGGGTWSSVALGWDHGCGLKTNGTIWCWGYGGHGDLGRGSVTDSSVPVQESTGSTAWTALTSGGYSSCAQRSSGALYCWGDNDHGQLGDGTTSDQQTPVVSGSDTTWGSISAGYNLFCGVRDDQAVWCQGDDALGQLGQHYNTSVGSPTPVGASAMSWSTGSVGYEGGCGIAQAGTMWCWGDNTYGAAGQGDTGTDYDYPVQAGSSSAWRSVSVGTWTVCATRTDNSLWCWGTATYGQTGVSGATGSITTPTAAAAGTWSSVSVGETHTCGVRTTGALACWGDNTDGELGIGSTTDQDTPQAVTVSGVSSWASVSAGYYSTCAIAATGANAGSLYCWGKGNSGQIGNGGTSDVTSPAKIGSATWSAVTVGRATVCGVRTAGTLWCWGLNDYGQLGQGGTAGTPASVSSPQQVGSASTWTQVSSGWGISCGTRADKSVWCWGRDDDGELGDRGSTTVTSPQQIPGFTATWLESHTSARTTLAM